MTNDEIMNKLIIARDAYYNGTSVMTDEEFDKLEDEFYSLDPENSYFSMIGYTVKKNKIKHKIPMGSQSKVKINVGGLDYIRDSFLSVGDCVASYKLDGISFSLNYTNGSLVNAITRGNGFIGEEIVNPTVFNHVPRNIEDKSNLTVRGELMMTYSDFELVNSQLSAEDKFSNPRNAVSGIIRNLTSPFRKYITAYFYDINSSNITFTHKQHKFSYIAKIFGQKSTAPFFINISASAFNELALKLDKDRKTLPFMIDGLVVEFDNLEYYESLGVANGNKPKGSVALKFNAVAESTKVVGVEWQAGSTGTYTPVLIVEPVLIDGSVVQRASLHNYDIFKEWDLCVGDDVIMQKNNDIIPQLQKVVSRNGGNKIPHIDVCSCGSILEFVKVSKTTNIVCTNSSCIHKYVGNIKKWVQKSNMMSKGVGDAFIEKYANTYEYGISGLYDLTQSDIIDMGYGNKSSLNIYNAIQDSKELELHDFFGGLNIQGCGSRVFKKLIDHINAKTVNDVVEWVISNDISEVNGIGVVGHKNIKNGIISLVDIINDIQNHVTIKEPKFMSGGSYLFTGKFTTINDSTGKTYTRPELEQLLLGMGHTPAKSMSKNLSYLVVGGGSTTESSKSKKAKEFGVHIMNEEEFFESIK